MTTRFVHEHCCGCVLCLYYVEVSMIRHQWQELLYWVSRDIMSYMNIDIMSYMNIDVMSYMNIDVMSYMNIDIMSYMNIDSDHKLCPFYFFH